MRTAELEAKYQNDKLTGKAKHLNDEPALKEWKYWRLVNNRYPYDKIMDETHHMIVLKRDVHVFSISSEELHELWFEIFPWADDHYHVSNINFDALRSISSTPHIHILNIKEEYR